MDEKDRKAHPLSEIFPLATDKEIAEMAADIGSRGLVEPIVLLDEMILDGRNRHKACLIAGKPPRFRKYAGSDPLGDVVSWNRHRRHLTPSDLAQAALKYMPLLAAQAKKRQTAALKKGTEIPVKATLPEREKGQARDQAAKALGVSGRLVQDAALVQRSDPALSAEVTARKLTVSAARKQLDRKRAEETARRKSAAAASGGTAGRGVPSDHVPSPPCRGMQMARIAIMKLGEIEEDDVERQQAFNNVKEWIHEHERTET